MKKMQIKKDEMENVTKKFEKENTFISKNYFSLYFSLVFSLFNIVTFKNDACVTNSGTTGTTG